MDFFVDLEAQKKREIKPYHFCFSIIVYRNEHKGGMNLSKDKNCQCNCVEEMARQLNKDIGATVFVFEAHQFSFGKIAAVKDNSVLVLERVSDTIRADKTTDVGSANLGGTITIFFDKIYVSICEILEYGVVTPADSTDVNDSSGSSGSSGDSECKCKCVEELAEQLKKNRGKNVAVYENPSNLFPFFGRIKDVKNDGVLILEDAQKTFFYGGNGNSLTFLKLVISMCVITNFGVYPPGTLANDLQFDAIRQNATPFPLPGIGKSTLLKTIMDKLSRLLEQK